jgi:hypothetical protein
MDVHAGKQASMIRRESMNEKLRWLIFNGVRPIGCELVICDCNIGLCSSLPMMTAGS